MAILLNSRAASPGTTFCLYNQPTCPANTAGIFPTRDINLVGQATSGRNAPWVMETWPLDSFGRRATENVNEAWQVEAGFTYDLPIKDWTAEVYYSRGESSTYNIGFGNNSLARWRALVTAPDYARNASLQSNLTNNPGANPGFGSVAAKCTTGFYDTIFKGDAVPSADCQYAVQAPLQTRTQNQQDIFELNFQGGLVNLPAGEMRGAWGYQQRRNASQFNPDILQSTASFTDQVIGVYPSGYLRKSTVAKDIWAEALIPVLSDLPFLKKFELEVGGRHSSYSTTASTDTYKINANIQINDWIRFRGGFNKANRAPNLGELYLPLQQNFTGSGVYTDACSLRSNSPFGAGGARADVNNPGVPTTLAPGQTAAGAQSAYLICRAMMGANGATYFYDNPTVAQTAAGGSLWNNQVGNKDLKSEKANTYTAGVVLRSPFQHPLANRIQVTADWYQIRIKDAILLYSADYAAYRCYGAVQVTNATEAAAQAASAGCQNVPRNQAFGGPLSTLLSFDNQAWVKTSGIDFNINWSADLADMGLASVPGALNLGVNGSWLRSYKTKTSPASYDPVVEWKGTLGPALNSFNGGSYDYRLFTNLGWSVPSFGLNLRWRHLPEVEPASKATLRANIANNKAVAAGAPGLLLGYTPSVAYNVPQFDQFDLGALRFMLSGAAPLSADVAAEAGRRIGVEIVQGYGMTELSPVTHFTPQGHNRPGSAGLAVPNTECRIVDPVSGESLGPDREGELWIRGPQVMAGYLNNPEATAATLDADGWLHTGDIARIDAGGYVYLVDRLKELIKYKGFQVPPAELEALLLTHPAVADAAVVGEPDEEAGELPIGFVVLKPGATTSADELRAFVAGQVAHYKQLRRITFIDVVPKSASGKILRRELRRR